MKANSLVFESDATCGAATLRFNGVEKRLSIILRNSNGTLETDTVATDTFETLLHDVLSTPDFLIDVLAYFPHTHDVIAEYFCPAYDEEF